MFTNETKQVKITKTLNDVLTEGYNNDNFSISNKNSREVEVVEALVNKGLAQQKFNTPDVRILALTEEGKNAALVINGAYGYLTGNF